MRNLTLLAVLLQIGGVILLILALLAAGVSFTAWLERLRYGPGLMFADVEFFGLAALAFAIPGLACIFLSRKLSRSH